MLLSVSLGYNSHHMFKFLAALALPWAVVSNPNYAPAVDVAVLGGGFSGLTAAKDIVAADKSVVVLEARDRIGGRIWDTHYPTVTSPNWVVKMGVNFSKVDDEGSSLLFFRGVLTKSSSALDPTALPIDEAGLKELVAALENVNTLANSLDVEAPWDHPRAKEWDSLSLEAWIKSTVNSTEARELLALMGTLGFTEETPSISFFSLLVNINGSGNETVPGSIDRIGNGAGGAQEYICKGGCHQIALKVAARLGPKIVKLNSATRHVKETKDGYEISTDSGVFRAKKVIIAMSPPLASRIQYSPPLPAGRDQLTQRLPMGSVIKVLARYPTPFWREEGLNGQVLSDGGLMTTTFDNSPEDGSFGVLGGFIEADRARSMYRKSEGEIKKAVTKEFVKYFGPKAKTATSWFIVQWDNEEYTRGGYGVSFPPGVLSRFGPFLTKQYRGIHFAGVEASPYQRDYMDGAIRSGERAAKEVLAALGEA
ncbi:hypothetical protein NW765_017552 [Fusarium oxysporum]|nr:hypothetical protein NW765_017552 [Fusarium oxysporum]KAJ4263699.1 hypothetical protein NW764_016081 [Fusarium oxysporum]